MPKTSESKSEVIAEAERKQASTEAAAFVTSKKLPRTPTAVVVAADVHQPPPEAQQPVEVVTPSKLSALKDKAQDTVKRVLASIRDKTPVKLAQEAESFKAFLRITPPGNTPPASMAEAPAEVPKEPAGQETDKTVSSADARLRAMELEASMQSRLSKVPSAKSLEEHRIAQHRDEHGHARAKEYFGKVHEQAEALFKEIAASKRSSPVSVRSGRSIEDTATTYSRMKVLFPSVSAASLTDKTLTEKEVRSVVPFQRDEVEQMERDAHAFDDSDPIARLALEARAKRQLKRRVAEDRRDALYSARRVDEQKWATKLNNPEINLGDDPFDRFAIRRTGLPRSVDTSSRMSKDTYLRGAVRLADMDTASRISVTDRQDAGPRLARMLVFEPRSEEFTPKEDFWMEIEAILAKMKKAQPAAIRRAHRLAKQSIKTHLVDMVEFRNRRDPPKIMEAVVLLRQTYEDCQNAPLIVDLLLRHGFSGKSRAAEEEKKQMIKEIRALAEEGERFREWIVRVLREEVVLDEGELQEGTEQRILKFKLDFESDSDDSSHHGLVRLREDEVEQEEVQATALEQPQVHELRSPPKEAEKVPRDNPVISAVQTRTSTPRHAGAEDPAILDLSGLDKPRSVNTEEGIRQGKEIQNMLTKKQDPKKDKAASGLDVNQVADGQKDKINLGAVPKVPKALPNPVPLNLDNLVPVTEGATAVAPKPVEVVPVPEKGDKVNHKAMSYQFLIGMAALGGPKAQEYAYQAEMVKVGMEIDQVELQRLKLLAQANKANAGKPLEEKIRQLYLRLEQLKANNEVLKEALKVAPKATLVTSVPPPTAVKAMPSKNAAHVGAVGELRATAPLFIPASQCDNRSRGSRERVSYGKERV